METMTLPSRKEMLTAVMSRDAGYDGVFVTAVRTTGIFCRPSCSAKKPLPAHVDFYPTAREALIAGFRPCLRCRPLESAGETPEWLRPLIAEVEEDVGFIVGRGETRRAVGVTRTCAGCASAPTACGAGSWPGMR